jgi:hypothetical protein
MREEKREKREAIDEGEKKRERSERLGRAEGRKIDGGSKIDEVAEKRIEGRNTMVVSDSYPAFFLPIATTSNKNF